MTTPSIKRRPRCPGCEGCAGLPQGIRPRSHRPPFAPFRVRMRKDGFDLREAVYATKAEALKAYRDSEHIDPTIRPDRRSSVEAYAAAYIDSMVDEWGSVNTERRYRSFLRNWLVGSPFGASKLVEVNKTTVKAYLVWLRRQHSEATGRPLSLGTIENAHAFVSGMLRHAEEAGKLRAPVRMPPKPKPDGINADPKPIVVPTQAELLTLVAEAEGHRWRPLLELAIYTGMRQGESLALVLPNVSLPARSLTIERTLHEHGRRRHATKTERSVRTIRIPSELADTLAAHLEAERLERRQRPTPISAGEVFVFTTRNGQPVPANSLRDWLYRLQDRSGMTAERAARGLERMRWHDLRHHFVTYQLAKHVPLDLIAFQVGDTERQLRDTYAHFIDSMRDEVADVAAGMLVNDR